MFNKTTFQVFFNLPEILSKQHLFWIVSWKHTEKTRKAFIFLKQRNRDSLNRGNQTWYVKHEQGCSIYKGNETLTSVIIPAYVHCIFHMWNATFELGLVNPTPLNFTFSSLAHTLYLCIHWFYQWRVTHVFWWSLILYDGGFEQGLLMTNLKKTRLNSLRCRINRDIAFWVTL